jgi:hypothetical protein
MFGILTEIERLTDELLGSFDPGLVTGADAEQLVERFGRLERRLATAKLLAARRAAECRAHTAHGDKSAARWLARTTGLPVGQAAAQLDTAELLASLPDTESAARAGELSSSQLGEIASAAAADPSAEGDLLASARRDGFARLRERCQAVRAAVAPDSRHEGIRRQRSLRNWTDREGAGHLHWRGTTDDLAVILAGLEPHRRRLFDEARRAGRREPAEAYLADGLVAMASARGHDQTPRPKGADAKVIVLIDHAALVRGHTHAGETCEIDGVGPVPVSVVREMMADAFLAAVVTDGIDVYRVAHIGRDPTAVQRTALQVRDRTCANTGCGARYPLEVDHVEPWAATETTRLDDLARLCPHDHDLKTYEGWRLVGSRTRRRLVPPELAPQPP